MHRLCCIVTLLVLAVDSSLSFPSQNAHTALSGNDVDTHNGKNAAKLTSRIRRADDSWGLMPAWGKRSDMAPGDRENFDGHKRDWTMAAWGKRSSLDNLATDKRYDYPAYRNSFTRRGEWGINAWGKRYPAKSDWNSIVAWGKRRGPPVATKRRWNSKMTWGKRGDWGRMNAWGKRNARVSKDKNSHRRFLGVFDRDQNGHMDEDEIKEFLDWLKNAFPDSYGAQSSTRAPLRPKIES